jgi:hypothetical protein
MKKKDDEEYRIIHRSEYCIYTTGLNDLQQKVDPTFKENPSLS